MGTLPGQCQTFSLTNDIDALFGAVHDGIETNSSCPLSSRMVVEIRIEPRPI
jgi:hypothetical protein